MTDPNAPSPAKALEDIVDDVTPRAEAIDWAVEQLRNGRGFEDVQQELTTGGWGSDDAGQIVEHARQQTRAERGVVTREQVMKTVTANYRAGMGGGMIAGLPTIAAIRRLMFAIATMKFLRRR